MGCLQMIKSKLIRVFLLMLILVLAINISFELRFFIANRGRLLREKPYLDFVDMINKTHGDRIRVFQIKDDESLVLTISPDATINEMESVVTEIEDYDRDSGLFSNLKWVVFTDDTVPDGFSYMDHTLVMFYRESLKNGFDTIDIYKTDREEYSHLYSFIEYQELDRSYSFHSYVCIDFTGCDSAEPIRDWNYGQNVDCSDISFLTENNVVVTN